MPDLLGLSSNSLITWDIQMVLEALCQELGRIHRLLEMTISQGSSLGEASRQAPNDGESARRSEGRALLAGGVLS